MARNLTFTASERHIRERLEMLRYTGFVWKIHGLMDERAERETSTGQVGLSDAEKD